MAMVFFGMPNEETPSNIIKNLVTCGTRPRLPEEDLDDSLLMKKYQ